MRQHEFGDVDLLGEDLEVPGDHPGRIDQLANDRVHAVGVVDDALQHHGALLLGHDVPALLEGVTEPLHGGEG